LVNNRGPVENVAAYYKALVQDLRRKKQLRLDGEATDHIWLMEDRPGLIGIRMDCGDSGVVYVTPSQAKDLATQLTCVLRQMTPQPFVGGARANPSAVAVVGQIIAGNIVQCAKCYNEEGSFSCIRPAHQSQ